MEPLKTRSRAFTLVELLVVLGIIAVLVALLLPSIARARKQAARVVCQSNLRQVAHAMLAYAEANRGSFPAAAFAEIMYEEDWIHWQPFREVRTGGIMPYLDGNLEVLKCPLGVPERGPTIRTGGGGPFVFPPYPFSYTMSVRFTGYSSGVRFNPNISGEPYARLGRIISPSEKAMMIEEDVTGINDGMWNPASGDYLTARYSSVSLRHDRDREYWGDPKVGGSYFPSRGSGNVAFADGHCEFYPRSKLQLGRYTNPIYSGP